MENKDQHYDPQDHEPLPEGDEAPPPMVKTMATVRWVILGSMSIFALVMVLGYFGLAPWAGSGSKAVQYHCPMHPTYISNEPGECPICGMSLVPIDASGEHPAEATPQDAQSDGDSTSSAMQAKPGQYTCPMHPEVVSDVPGRCPKCNMFLEKAGEAATKYTCPMHPEVVSDKPGSCPKCGMDLVPEEQRESEHSGQEMHDMTSASGSTVPGLVSVTIEPQRLQLIGVRYARVERRSLSDNLRLVGYLTADETKTANVHVRVSGWVSKLYVDQTGQYVRAGEPLLSIYSQELAQAQQDFIVARKAVAKVIADSELSFMRKQLLDSARERLKLLGLSSEEIRALEEKDSVSNELILRSPVSGFVMEKAVSPQQYVGPDLNLYTISNLSDIWVLADVYEQDLKDVEIGQKAEMQVSALPGEMFVGKVGFIYPSISQQTRTLKIRLEFSNASLKLHPGMYAEVNLIEEKGDVTAVPVEAVMDGGETQYAFVVHDRRHFEPRLLTLGKSSGDWVEVLSGLSEGEEVVSSANFLIDSESRLKAAIAGMGGTQATGHEGHGQ